MRQRGQRKVDKQVGRQVKLMNEWTRKVTLKIMINKHRLQKEVKKINAELR